MRHLAQALADQAAALEAQPLRDLPVLTPDLLVVDQLAVTGDDLVRVAGLPRTAGELPDQLRAAVDHLLLHRWELLGEEPPTSLGGTAALTAGRTACSAGRTTTAGHPAG